MFGLFETEFDLELNAVDACDVEAVDLEGAGLVIGDRGIEGGFDVLELRDEGVLGKGILIVDEEAKRVVPIASGDRLSAEVEGAVLVYKTSRSP